MQIAGVINDALTRLRDAGAVLVPFDSTAFEELAVSAWPGATADTISGLDASSNYESIVMLGRWVTSVQTVCCSVQKCVPPWLADCNFGCVKHAGYLTSAKKPSQTADRLACRTTFMKYTTLKTSCATKPSMTFCSALCTRASIQVLVPWHCMTTDGALQKASQGVNRSSQGCCRGSLTDFCVQAASNRQRASTCASTRCHQLCIDCIHTDGTL